MGIIYYLVAFLYTHILYCLNRYKKIIKLLLTLKWWTFSREKVQKYANYCLVVFRFLLLIMNTKYTEVKGLVIFYIFRG